MASTVLPFEDETEEIDYASDVLLVVDTVDEKGARQEAQAEKTAAQVVDMVEEEDEKQGGRVGETVFLFVVVDVVDEEDVRQEDEAEKTAVQAADTIEVEEDVEKQEDPIGKIVAQVADIIEVEVEEDVEKQEDPIEKIVVLVADKTEVVVENTDPIDYNTLLVLADLLEDYIERYLVDYPKLTTNEKKKTKSKTLTCTLNLEKKPNINYVP